MSRYLICYTHHNLTKREILHANIQQYMLQTELPKVYFKGLTMLFYKMSSNDRTIRKNRLFYVFFNMVRIQGREFRTI